MATGISANRLELLQIADAVAREKAIEKEIVAGLSENDAKAAVAGYEKYRTFIDDALYNEVSFAK